MVLFFIKYKIIIHFPILIQLVLEKTNSQTSIVILISFFFFFFFFDSKEGFFKISVPEMGDHSTLH